MGIEIMCEKPVKDKAEQIYWGMRLSDGEEIVKNSVCKWDWDEDIFYSFNKKTKRLTWGGWSLKRLPNTGNSYDPTDFKWPGKHQDSKSVSKKKLEHNLNLWPKSSQDEMLKHFDKNSKWYTY